PHLAHRDRVLLGGPVGRVVGRRVRHTVEQTLERGLRLGELAPERLQSLLHVRQLGELLGRRLPLQLRPRAQLLPLGLQGALALVGGEQLVERLRRALAGERRAVAVGVGSGGAQVDHAVECRSASSTCATPSSSTEGQIQLATAFTRSCALATAMPKDGHSTSSTSFSPSPKAIVCSFVKPSRRARKSRPAPFVTPARANSRKCGSDFEMYSRAPKCSFSR